MNHIFYLIGKSSSGKDSLYEAILNSNLGLTPLLLYTTRPKRDGEIDGKDYHFVSEDTLDEYRKQGKVIEERTYQTVYGPWTYFTANVGNRTLNLDKFSYLGIGTLVSYQKLREYFGEDVVIPLYIEVEDGIRLERAMEREKRQTQPKYKEMCRRFLADQKDYSEENIERIGITKRFNNNGKIEKCLTEVQEYIESILLSESNYEKTAYDKNCFCS